MLNNVILMGRLTVTPVLNQTRDGVLVTSFSIAVDRRFQRQGEEKKTDFLNCVAWRNTAEFISKYFNKGDMIAVKGEINTRQYQDKETGKNRTAWEIVIDEAYFCGSKSSGNNTADTAAGFTSEFSHITDDDLPF